MLTEIHDALSNLNARVYYGGVSDPKNVEQWEYIVFARQNIRRGANNRGYTDVISVAVVWEEYIPEGFVEAVIEAMEALPGMRLTDGGVEYTYTRKANTDTIVEMAVMSFALPRKRCAG